jgi:two-component system alkaline phosphatase synthesis response regulator PhoP
MPEAKRVLVADDSETVTTLLVTALELEGYQVDTALNGVEAYEKGISGDFDLVILDQLMPGLLGLEIIERWQTEGRPMRVIMLSGVDDDRTVVHSLDLGAVDFVRKPFRLPELMARIGSVCSAEKAILNAALGPADD